MDAIAVQTDRPDEVIVVDNNSNDATAEIARSYKFVRLLRESRQGVVFARDCGFNAAKSSLLGRIDADTVLPPDWVERVKGFYADQQHSTYALTGGCFFYNVRCPRLARWWQGQIAFRANRLLMGHYILFGSNMAMPQHLWKSVKDKVCHIPDVHEDLDLAIHVHEFGYEITYLENLRVGVKMRRVRSNQAELWSNMMWWPRTLRKHGKRTWPLGLLGALILYIGAPAVIVAELLARLVGRPPLDE